MRNLIYTGYLDKTGLEKITSHDLIDVMLIK